ncbi:MAG: Mur ligase family protein, partial [Chitinophagales bacterium]|nr:Mur ligase family protein [Chitinophagales bacterium]
MEIEGLYRLYRSSKGVSTDSRTLQPGQMFFALRGQFHDGNAYAYDALSRGAVAAVVDDATLKGEKIIYVSDALIALQQLAAHHRRQLRTTFMAIGGSNGKTTTKELASAVLQKKFHVYATHGNRNNHIGVPLSLLEVRDATEVAVL